MRGAISPGGLAYTQAQRAEAAQGCADRDERGQHRGQLLCPSLGARPHLGVGGCPQDRGALRRQSLAPPRPDRVWDSLRLMQTAPQAQPRARARPARRLLGGQAQ